MSYPKRHDAVAFDDVVREHRHIVYGYFRARLTNDAEAVRLTEKTFERFYLESAGKLDEIELREKLLFHAGRLLRQHARLESGRPGSDWTAMCLDLDDAGFRCQNDDDVSRIAACVNALEPAERDAITMKYRSGLTLLQIGERLRRSENAARQLLHRARTSLRMRLRS